MAFHLTQGTFSFLPPLDRRRDPHAGAVLPGQRLADQRGVHRRSSSAQHLLGNVGIADV